MRADKRLFQAGLMFFPADERYSILFQYQAFSIRMETVDEHFHGIGSFVWQGQNHRILIAGH